MSLGARESDYCDVCGGMLPDHDMRKHAAAREKDKVPRGREPQTAPPVPRDPVLRALLVRKGVLTADELAAAEDELRKTGALLS